MIAPMKKVSLVCMKEDREKLLSALQHSELIMLTEGEGGRSGDDRDSTALQRKADTLLKELSKFTKKKGLFEALPEVDRKDFDVISESAVDEMSRLEEAFKKKDRLDSEINGAVDKLSELTRWVHFKKDVSLLGESGYTVTLLGTVPVKNNESLLEIESLGTEELYRNEKECVVLVSFIKSEDVTKTLRELQFEEAKLPIKSGVIADEVKSLEAFLTEKKKEREESISELSDLANKSKADVELLFEQYRARSELSEIRLPETLETVVFEGWVREDEIERFKEAVKEATPHFDVEIRDPEEGEEVPTSLTNKKLVSQFEGITNMFNSPKYGDYDPNAVMAPWYWIIFGMMMGDAGYGLMMAVFILLGKKLMKPRGETAKLMNVMLYSSITTIIFGVLFGSYFGEELFPSVLPFTAMEDPVKMLIITIVVGVLHIFTGMITKIVLLIKEGLWLEAIFDQVSWMMIILGIGFIFLPNMTTAGIVIAVIGALIVLLTGGRSKKGILGKATGGIISLYGITSYFSDILSYSRILALGLATGVVGMVMNMLAGMIQGSVIGFILYLLIYVIGHVFNLVLGLLSAYVHDCRLQYIEFYGKFYEGGGVPFRPFKIRTNYINIKKD